MQHVYRIWLTGCGFQSVLQAACAERCNHVSVTARSVNRCQWNDLVTKRLITALTYYIIYTVQWWYGSTSQHSKVSSTLATNCRRATICCRGTTTICRHLETADDALTHALSTVSLQCGHNELHVAARISGYINSIIFIMIFFVKYFITGLLCLLQSKVLRVRLKQTSTSVCAWVPACSFTTIGARVHCRQRKGSSSCCPLEKAKRVRIMNR